MLCQEDAFWCEFQRGARLLGKASFKIDPLGRGFHGTDRLPSFGGRSDHLAARSLNPCGGIPFGMKRVIGHQGNSLSESGGGAGGVALPPSRDARSSDWRGGFSMMPRERRDEARMFSPCDWLISA